MPAHICASLISLVQRDPSRPATLCDGRRATAQQFHDRIALLSRALSTACNICLGDRVAIAGLNTDVFFEALLAIVDAGAVACPLNTRWSSTEIAAALELTRPKFVIVDSSAEPLAVAACARLAGTAPQMIMLGSEHTSGVGPALRNSSSTVHISTQLTTEKLISDATHASVLHHSAASAGPMQQSRVHLSQSTPERVPLAVKAVCSPLLQLRQSGPDGTALICFTSGTTGRSKGAMLSHSALLHQSLSKLSAVGYTADDVYLHVAPLFHIGGISSALAVLTAGGMHVFMTRYHPSTILQLIADHNVTAMIAVPAMMKDITTAAAAAQHSQQQHVQQQQRCVPSQQQQQQQLITLKRVLIGGGTMTAELQSAVAALFPNALLSTAYGMTEASSSMTFITLHEQQQRQAAAAAAAGVCVGWPAPGIAVRIDPAALEQQQQQAIQYSSSSSSSSRSSSSADQRRSGGSSSSSSGGCNGSGSTPVIGEVCTLGPHIMSGYWGQPDVTKLTITHDGWLKTGDLGYLDEKGCLWLIGRSKDMIKSGGENVHAAEVESALMTHPAVAAAAAVGLPHQRLGEQVAAAVVLRPGWSWVQGDSNPNHQQQQQGQQQQVLSAQNLQHHCRSVAELSAYKLPRALVAVRSLPTNSSGKVVKAEVRTIIQQQQQQQQQDVVSGGKAPVALRSRL